MISCKLNAHQPYSIGNPFGCQNDGRVAYVGCEPTVLGDGTVGSLKNIGWQEKIQGEGKNER